MCWYNTKPVTPNRHWLDECNGDVKLQLAEHFTAVRTRTVSGGSEADSSFLEFLGLGLASFDKKFSLLTLCCPKDFPVAGSFLGIILFPQNANSSTSRKQLSPGMVCALSKCEPLHLLFHLTGSFHFFLSSSEWLFKEKVFCAFLFFGIVLRQNPCQELVFLAAVVPAEWYSFCSSKLTLSYHLKLTISPWASRQMPID